MSLQEIFELFNNIKNSIYTIDHYLIYQHLKRLGYIILRTKIYEKYTKQNLQQKNNEQEEKLQQKNNEKEKNLHYKNNNFENNENIKKNKNYRDWFPFIPTSNTFKIPIEIIPSVSNTILSYSDLKKISIYSFQKDININFLNNQLIISYDIYSSRNFSKKKYSIDYIQPLWRLCICK